MTTPSAVPAVPPTFHFKMRLVDSTGKAFEAKDYQLWWGGKLVQEGVTGSGGLVQAELDDNYDSGLLDVGERDEQGKFVGRWTIPVEGVPAPPPPPKQVRPPKAASPRRTPQQRDPNEWTDEADPPPPFPQYPRYPEDQDAWRHYMQQKKAWEDWEQRRAERRREWEAHRKASEEWRDRERIAAERRRKYSETPGGLIPAPIQETPAPPMSPEEQEAMWQRLQQARERSHSAKVRLHGLSWRLRNLGYLPDTTILVFPVEGQARERVLQALRRYAHKNNLSLPEELDLGDPDSAAMKALEDHIRKEHDC